jgi:hypothetical protein
MAMLDQLPDDYNDLIKLQARWEPEFRVWNEQRQKAREAAKQ